MYKVIRKKVNYLRCTILGGERVKTNDIIR